MGVIILCLFTKRFPFFNSNDDAEALLEIAHIYGLEDMKKLAQKLGTSVFIEQQISSL